MRKLFCLFLCLVNCSFVVAAQNFIKPVAVMPEYNGSYRGSPFTGNTQYTTLYRDNQDNGNRSGCRGEGCGRHPGVDIAIPSGTSVVNPLGGVVVVTRCDAAWGGLVVIKSNHPWRSGESVYQTFAHLRARQYSNQVALKVGDYVTTGVEIGKSGGNGANDPCSGNSTGSHLHYQIDKDDGNSEPWYPSQNVLHYRDDDYQVMTKTYNPIVFIQGGYRWKFAENNNRELWDLYNWQSWGVTNSALWLDGNIDPYIRRGGLTNCGLSKPCNSSIALEAADYGSMYVDMANQCSARDGKIYFITKDDQNWNQEKSVNFTILSNGTFRNLVLMHRHPKWWGIVIGLRVDPGENCAAHFDPSYFGEVSIVR